MHPKLKGLEGQIIHPSGTFTKIGEDMVWPSYDQGELEWNLRHAKEEQVVFDRMRTAAIVSAYKALLDLPQKCRNTICRAIKEAD